MFYLTRWLFLLLASASLYAGQIELGSPVSARIYNSVAAQYISTPTFAMLSDDGKDLRIKIKRYGVNKISKLDVEYSAFNLESVGPVLVAISKFLEWEEIAAGRGDILNKTISSNVPVFSFGNVRTFSIFSANENSRYLAISDCDGEKINVCMLAGQENFTWYLDRAEAIRLQILFNDFKNGALKEKAIPEGVYK